MDNELTVSTYNEKASDYISSSLGSSSEGLLKHLQRAVEGLNKSSAIFEIGSGPGKDAKYLESLGFTVQRTDASLTFVELLKKDGFDAILFNALKDAFPRDLDLVLADAVLLHFTGDEAALVINKVFKALCTGGAFSFTLKEGVGENWSLEKLNAPRFFKYWQADDITTLLKEQGFRTVLLEKDFANSINWLNIKAIK